MEHSSNSLILKNILENETCELKQMIDNLMSEKLKEFQQQVKTNIDKVVTERIQTFYNTSYDELDEIVFNEEPNTYAIQSCIETCEGNLRHPMDETNRKYYNEMINRAKKLSSQKMFTIFVPYHQCSISVYIFKNCVLDGSGTGSPVRFMCYNHILPINILLGIKVLLNNTSAGQLNQQNQNRIITLINYYNENPQHFQPNCIEFEQICQREYSQIEKTKEEFEELTEEAHRILDENTSKKDYYDILDQRIEQITKDEERLKEEKQKLFIVKERLLEMKTELERERQELEEEKRKYLSQKKSIDIDKCFEDLL
jgi:hypothetical protein